MTDKVRQNKSLLPQGQQARNKASAKILLTKDLWKEGVAGVKAKGCPLDNLLKTSPCDDVAHRTVSQLNR